MKKNRLFLIVSFILTLAFGCARQMEIFTICTDIPAFAAYIEYYNNFQDDYKILINFNENLIRDILNEKCHSDFVISENLATPLLMEHFAPLNELLKPEALGEERFYRDLLKLGYHDEFQKLLPLSFSLPMVLFKETQKDSGIPSLIIPLDMVKEQSLKFYPGNSKRFAFSPFWDKDFLYSSALLFNSRFQADAWDSLLWDDEALTRSINFFKDWFDKIKGGFGAEEKFNDKYMNIPPYKLLTAEKILYYYTSSTELFSIPREKRKGIDFRWLSSDGKIPVLDDITYVGIMKGSMKIPACENFLNWLFDPFIQSKILEINNYKRIQGHFGIANKFSSLPEVNEKYMSQHYPIFVGHIPESDFLSFPVQLSEKWPEMKQNVIIPYIYQKIINNDYDKNLENLLNF